MPISEQNLTRAQRVDAYYSQYRQRHGDHRDQRSTYCDLITDLLHHARRAGLNTNDMLLTSDVNYAEEVYEETH